MTSTLEEHAALYRDLAQAAQEVQLLTDILESVAVSTGIEDVVQMLATGIKQALAAADWSAIELLLWNEARHDLHAYQVQGAAENRYWNNVRRGARNAARDLGVQVDYTDGDQAEQIAQLHAALAAKVDGVALAAIDAESALPRVAALRAAGIPIVTFDTPLPNSPALAYIGTDNYAAGQLAAGALRRLLPEGGDVGVLLDSVQAENAMERVMGAETALGDATVQLLPPQEAEFDPQLGLRLARDLLQQQPDLRGAFGASGSAGPNWAAAARETGRSGAFKIVSFDIVGDTIGQLLAGRIHAAIAQREYAMGYRSVELLCRFALDGVEATLATLPAERTIDTGVDVVTLGRSDWSISLADYLRNAERREIDLVLRERLLAHGEPLRLAVIGITDKQARGTVERRVEQKPVAHVAGTLRTGRSFVGAGEGGVGTLVAVPLLSRGVVLGAISLASAATGACSPADLALLERVAGALAIVIEHTRLFRQLDRRAREIEQAYTQQNVMLQTINELSNTVVPIARGVLVVPMVGTIDTTRAAQFVEMLLVAIGERQAEVVIIDITGVAVVDTNVAHHILQAARAAQLLGTEVIVVGITPAVAQTIVQLGVQLPGVGTFADLETGFAYALGKVGGRIMYNKETRRQGDKEKL